MGRQYRAGIIGRTGGGDYGHGMDVVWGGIENVTVAAVADPDESGRDAAQARSGAKRAYADYREMLEHERLDLVSVGPRWPDLHEEIVVAAVEAGVRGILCEKPLARTPAEADRMLAAADRAGAKIAVALQHRSMKVVHEMRRIVQGGDLGVIREIRGRPTIGPRGGPFLFAALGTHIVDLMRYLLGADPLWAFGRITSRRGEVMAEEAQQAPEAYGALAGDAVAAVYGFPRGITGCCDSYFAPEVLPGTMTLEVWGTDGVVALRQGRGSKGAGHRYLYRWPAHSGGPVQELEHVPVAGWDDDPRSFRSLAPMNEHLARDLIAAMEESRQPLASGEDGRWALEMIFGAHESHLSGGRVPLPLRQRGNPYQATAGGG